MSNEDRLDGTGDDDGRSPAGIWGQARGRLLTELCGQPRTAIELAERVGTSANAVRVHLDALRELGLVDYRVERRGVGKPTHVFALTPAAEYMLSTAYAPVLRAILETVRQRGDGELPAVLRAAGARLAAGRDVPAGTRGAAARAVEVLHSLGAPASATRQGRQHLVRSACCPLGVVTRQVPETCALLESLLSEVCGRPVRERCDRGEHPRCAFVIGAEGATAPA